MPRSGTSLTAGLIALGGVHFGPTVPGNKNNPKGFFENSGFRKGLLKPYLRDNGWDPVGQKITKDQKNALSEGRIPEIPDLEKRMEGYVGANGNRWAIKDPKLMFIWPEIKRQMPRAKWVIVTRDDRTHMDSLERTKFIKLKDQALFDWVIVQRGILANLFWETGARMVCADDLINDCAGRETTLSHLEDILKIEIPRDKANKFIDRKLWTSPA